jgi:zinc protease
VEEARLGNGLRLLVSPSRAFPVVTLSLLLPAGGSSEPGARGGLASLVSELLESGTVTRDAHTIAEQVEGMGIGVDTGASWDWMQVGITGLTKSVEQSAEILADLVRNPVFPQEEVVRARQERLAEIAQNRPPTHPSRVCWGVRRTP